MKQALNKQHTLKINLIILIRGELNNETIHKYGFPYGLPGT